jgi:leucine dehydrogenase
LTSHKSRKKKKKTICSPPAPGTEARTALFRAYGSFATSLRGAYVVAEDAGVDTPDMADVFARTRFATCIPAELGGSANPSPATARGTAVAVRAALEAVEG